MKPTKDGYTLLEILLVLAIISILALIAYPPFTYLFLKAHRKDALLGLIQTQMAFERCYEENKAYDIPCHYLPQFPQKSPQGYYQISLASISPHEFTITAASINNQSKDKSCAKFFIDQINRKRAEDNLGLEQSSCWD